MRITDLYIYPVKSLSGIRLEQTQLSVTGLPWDRHWMVVDDSGRFVTQRQLPAMAVIGTAIDDTYLRLSHPDHDELLIPLEMTTTSTTEVTVWRSHCLAFDEGLEASNWLTSVLGQFKNRPLRLVRFAREKPRSVSEKYVRAGEDAHTEFADGFPFLIASNQSLNAVNDQLKTKGLSPVPIDRFRANIVVDEFGGPFQELFNATVASDDGSYQLAIRKPCERCPIVTVDQASGERKDKTEPLASLTELNPMQERKGAYFGGNAILKEGDRNSISVGDKLTASVD